MIYISNKTPVEVNKIAFHTKDDIKQGQGNAGTGRSNCASGIGDEVPFRSVMEDALVREKLVGRLLFSFSQRIVGLPDSLEKWRSAEGDRSLETQEE